MYLEGHLEALAAAAGVAQPVAREEVQHRGLPRHAAQRLCSSARRRRTQLTAGDLGGGGQHGDRDGRPSHDDRVALARRLKNKSHAAALISFRQTPKRHRRLSLASMREGSQLLKWRTAKWLS